MSDPTPPLDLAAIEARCAAATPGPWRVCDSYGPSYQLASPHSTPADEAIPWNDLVVRGCDEYDCGVRDSADAAFIAHSREDVPGLVARVRALEAEVAALSEIRTLLGDLAIPVEAFWRAMRDSNLLAAEMREALETAVNASRRMLPRLRAVNDAAREAASSQTT